MSVTKNESGFTLLSVMVSIMLVSLAMSALADMTIISAKSQKGIEIRSDFDSFAQSLLQTVSTESLCTPSLSGSDYQLAVMFKDPLVASSTIANVGDVHPIGWTLSNLRLQNVLPVPGYTDTYRADLMITGTRDVRIALGGPIMARQFLSIYFVVNPGTTVINHCYGTGTSWMTPSGNGTSGTTVAGTTATGATATSNASGASSSSCTAGTGLDNGNHNGEIANGKS